MSTHSSTTKLASRALRGTAAGTVATGAMSVVMLTAKRAGWMGKQPPERIVAAGLDALGVDRNRSTQRGLAAAAHVVYGAACGAVFATFATTLRRSHAAVAGAAFGFGVWALSYLGWVPALGIMPPAHRDRPGRPTAMIAAHLVYGAALGALLRPFKTRR